MREPLMPIAETRPGATPWVQNLTGPLKAALQHPWVESIVRLSAVEDALAGLHPMLSLSEVRVRVRKVIAETASTKTFVLQPNALWAGAQAGQFVRVRVEIDGRRVERLYSLSSRPGARRLAITVKRQDGGLVSPYLHQTVSAGTVLTLSQASGDFVLPQVLPGKMLLLSAGSGITPVMAMLRDLQARGYGGDVVFHHVCPNPAELIFAQPLQDIAAAFPALRLQLHFTQVAGPFSPATLLSAVPDLAERETWLCGPAGWMNLVQGFWGDEACTAPLHSERFSAPPLRPAAFPGAPVQVSFALSGKDFVTRGSAPLLVQAERAGLTPKHGCRIGICRSCQCVKTHGTVENLLTGEVSSAPEELIRLCISAAHSDLTLAL
jgi:ferredoxin-NADP reductase